MDHENDYPPRSSSFEAHKSLHTNIVDLKRKRKLLAEQLGGLPLPKHKSQNRCHSEPVFLLNEIPEVQDLGTHLSKERSVNSSNPESASDSNSIGECSAMPVHSGAKLESVCLKASTCNQPSTSSVNSGNYRSFHGPNSLDRMAEIETKAVKDVNKRLVSRNVEDHLQEFENHVNNICQEYINSSADQFIDNELSNVLYPLTTFDLQSQEAHRSARKKPTIDQEFEEYFSSLML